MRGRLERIQVQLDREIVALQVRRSPAGLLALSLASSARGLGCQRQDATLQTPAVSNTPRCQQCQHSRTSCSSCGKSSASRRRQDTL